MLNAIIVDDEQKNRETLKELLDKYCPQVNVQELVSSVPLACDAIQRLKPDLVFLDIEMPGENGFDLLEHFTNVDFEVIFVTAYSHYAIKAIQYSALDYLLKPIDINELKRAVGRTEIKRQNLTDSRKQVDLLLDNLKNVKSLQKLVVIDAKGFTIINKKDIIRCEASNSYTWIYLMDGSSILSTKTLKEYEQILKDDVFLRVHNSHLVNLNFIKRYERGEGGEGGRLHMTDDSCVDISRRRKNELMEAITLLAGSSKT